MTTLKMHSPNLVDSNIAHLAKLFPNCVTEKPKTDDNGNVLRDKDGQVVLELGVDFELLKQELSHSVIDGSQERYRLDWVGKREAIVTANSPIAKTLRPVRGESVDFDTTQNLFIEGDNLEALKLLQESYLGKVKMIYIDPPYNTGNDFIYNDDFAEDTQAFFERSGQVDEDGNRLVANTESNGRFHSDWLSMMYSRLKLARNLLADDGVIFISIDDNEVDNLIKLSHELFGANQNELYVWDTREKGKMPKTPKNTVRKEHEYILAVFKNDKLLSKYSSLKYLNNEDWSNVDNDPRGNWMSANISRSSGEATGGKNSYIIKNPAGIEFYRDWSLGEEEFKELLKDNRIYFSNDGQGVPRKKIFQNEPVLSVQSSLFQDLSSSQSSSNLLKELFNFKAFDFPKPIELIKRITAISTENDSLILDFFAGSSTTAHAVMQLNAEDGGNRKFIMVQIPEATDPKSEAYKAGYPTIAEISKERIRRAGVKIREDNSDKDLTHLDTGFRVLKIDTTNMADIYYRPEDYSQDLLGKLENNIKPDRTDEDLLFQFMLDTGVPLSLPIARTDINGHAIYQVGGNSLIASLDHIDANMISEIAKMNPLKFITSERAIATDSDKTNIVERFKQLSPTTDVRFI